MFTALKGVRCDPGNAVGFTTDNSGNGSAVLNLGRYAGQLVHLAMFLAPNYYFGPDYAVTAPLTVDTAPKFVSTTSTNGNPVAVVTLSKPIVCSP